jgi:hypothetical protein
MGLPVVSTNLPLVSTNVNKVMVNINNLTGCPIANTRCVTTVGIYAALPLKQNFDSSLAMLRVHSELSNLCT